MRKISIVTIFLLVTGLFIAGINVDKSMAAQKKGKAQTICPVMGDPINKKYYVDYKGYRIYFCCKDCPDIFKKNPDKYMKILRESGVTLEKTPAGDKHDMSHESMEDSSMHHQKH